MLTLAQLGLQLGNLRILGSELSALFFSKCTRRPQLRTEINDLVDLLPIRAAPAEQRRCIVIRTSHDAGRL